MSSTTTNLGLTKPDMTDTVSSTIPALASNFDKIDNGLGSLSKNRIDVTDSKYGAKGDTVLNASNAYVSGTNDTTSINNAIADLQSGDILIIPYGTYYVTSPITITQSFITVYMFGTLYAPNGGIVLNGCSYSDFYGLQAVRSNVWADGNTGILLENLMNCEVHIKQSTGFNYGVKCWGNNHGFGYNRIYLGLQWNNKYGLYLLTNGTTGGSTGNGGWVNENTFYHGRWTVDPTYLTANNSDPGWAVYFDKGDSNNVINNNRFITPSFESAHQGVYLNNGRNILLDHPRFEGVSNPWVKQESGGIGLTWLIGYTYPDIANVTILGTMNAFIGAQNDGAVIATDSPMGLDGLNAYPRIGKVPYTAWVTGTAYTLNQVVSSNGRFYQCTTAGTSGSTAPSGTGTGITDGTVVWKETALRVQITDSKGLITYIGNNEIKFPNGNKFVVSGDQIQLYNADGTTLGLTIGNGQVTVPSGWSINSWKLQMNSGNNIFAQSSIPTSGTYTKGDFVLNTNPTVLGSAGSQYTVHGWKRLSTGTANVAWNGTTGDWVEMRMPTGT